MGDEHFDAVVVGSGFGGSVTAFRLSEAGMRVCVLERGKAYPPGSFPRSPLAIARGLWDPSEGLHGIFNVWEFSGLGGIVASGLGGGSLLYSNILLRKDRSTFVQEDLDAGGWESWPVTYDDLEPHYERHEQMLQGTPYPMEHAPYDRTPKTVALKEAADTLGLEWILPKLAITFAPEAGAAPVLGEPVRGEEPNLHGRVRQTCRMCGECNFGCNYGSKYTLDFNYLSFAKLRHGADIRIRSEVKTFAPRPEGGFVIRYVDHSGAVEGEPRSAPPPEHVLTADRLILSAGTFGSTYLLLKNRASFPGLSERLGTRFCGNGDLLTFAQKTHETVNGVRRGRAIEPGYGPVITSTIRVPDKLEGGPGRAYYLQDGGYPDTINWMMEVGRPACRARSRVPFCQAAHPALAAQGRLERHRRRPLAPDREGSGLLHLPPPVLDGQGHPGRKDAPLRRPAPRARLEQDALEPDLRGGAQHRSRHRTRARRGVPGQPAVVRRPGRDRSPARRLPDGS